MFLSTFCVKDWAQKPTHDRVSGFSPMCTNVHRVCRFPGVFAPFLAAILQMGAAFPSHTQAHKCLRPRGGAASPHSPHSQATFVYSGPRVRDGCPAVLV